MAEKKKHKFPVILLFIAALLIAALIWWFTPTHLLKHIDNDEIAAIQVMDGNTYSMQEIRDPETIAQIADSIRSCTLKKTGLSFGYVGSEYILVFGDEDNARIEKLVINGSHALHKEPADYTVTEGQLCYELLIQLLEQSAE